MKRIAQTLPLTFAFLSGLIVFPTLRAQEDPTLDADRRRFLEVGSGFRAIRRGPDGSYYVLAPSGSPGSEDRPRPDVLSKRSGAAASSVPLVLIFDSRERMLRQIPARPQPGELVAPSSMDVDAAGRVYIGDQSANTVRIYASDGTPIAQLAVPEPTQIVALPHDRFAVCSANAERLIAVYDLSGALLRQFGEFADLSDDPEFNHRLNAGYLASDAGGTLYFAFRYLPEPTVRKYDPNTGALLDEMTLTTLDVAPMAQSARQEIARLSPKRAALPHEIISAMGVDPATQEIWLALGNLLMHFDNRDTNTATNRVYTSREERMVADFILVEKNDLLLGNDPLGIYEFRRFASNSTGKK